MSVIYGEFYSISRATRARIEEWDEVLPGWLIRPGALFNEDAIPWYHQIAHVCGKEGKTPKAHSVDSYGHFSTGDKYVRCWSCKTKVPDAIRFALQLKTSGIGNP